MSKVVGIKSVDFKIEASGSGVVNWNGTIEVANPEGGKDLNNHSVPKMRGFSNKSGRKNEEGTFDFKIKAADIDLKKTPVYVSQNCIRHHLFKEEAFNVTADIGSADAERLLCSSLGLLRGFAIADTQPLMKKSPLLMEDLIETTGNGNYEQMGKSGSRDQKTTMFSKTTLGETKYVGYGSISVEELSFISLDNRFGRASVKGPVSPDEGKELAKKVTQYLSSLDFEGNLKPEAVYHECYVRNGSVMDLGEAGILINHDGCSLLVGLMIEKVSNLYIQQAKGWLGVDSVLVDFNDSSRPMRIKKDEDSVSEEMNGAYAVYYRQGDSTNIEKSKEMDEAQSKNKQNKESAKTKTKK